MLDFLLGILIAGMLVRGWLRGLVREVLDLVGLVLGLWVAFKLSAPFGEFLTGRFGVSPEVAAVAGGFTLFLLFGVALSIGARMLSGVMKLPGLNLVNRIGGAVVAFLWAVLLILVLVNVARALPIPDSWDQAIDDSTVVEAIAGPGALPQTMFEALGSGHALASLPAIQAAIGTNRAVPEGNQVVIIPEAAPDEVRQVRSDAEAVLAWANEYRAGFGLGALAASDAYVDVAEARGIAMYTAGRISRDTPRGGSVLDDLHAAGLRPALAGENLALASSARAGFDGMLGSPSAQAQLGTSAYDRVGISVVDGPTGRLVIIVFGA